MLLSFFKRFQHHSLALFFGIAFFIISKDFGMFWDNIYYGSKIGNVLYNNGIINWSFPENLDMSSPPFLGFLLAISWKIFGYELWVSHLVMIPFTAGIIYQLLKLVHYYCKNYTYSYLGVLLLLADPSLSSQLVLVNQEIILLFFFFLSINGILYNKSHFKLIGLVFIGLVSARGLLLLTGFFLYDFTTNVSIKEKRLKTKFLYNYVIAFTLPISFLLWKYFSSGFLVINPNTNWSDHWQFADFTTFLKNLITLLHRYLDFGRIFIVLFVIVYLLKFQKKILHQEKIKHLIQLAFIPFIFIFLAVLFSKNASGHRYYIGSYILITLIAYLFVQELKKRKKLIFSILFIGLITGNLWIYPEKISQGWDSTLAHVPYHSLRKKAINYLDTKNIDFKDVGTFFPNYNSIDEIEFNKDYRKLSKFEKNKFVVYSNIYNVSDEEYQLLQNEYSEIQRFENFNIYVSILKKMD